MRELGPRARRVHHALRHRSISGALAPGAQLPSQPRLAATFGVATMTVRQALSQLEAEGLVSCEAGRGSFVRAPVSQVVLVVQAEVSDRKALAALVGRAGHRVVEAADAGEGLAALERDQTIGLVLTAARIPDAAAGIGFIRAVRQRWPRIPLAAVTAFPDDLAVLHGTRECPLLIIPKPFRASQIEEVLGLVLPRAEPSPGPDGRAVLLADDEPVVRQVVRELIEADAFQVEEVASGYEALAALQRRPFGHVFLDLRMPQGGVDTAQLIARMYPNTVVILATGYTADALTGTDKLVTVLPKPFDEAAVREALSLRRAPLDNVPAAGPARSAPGG